MKDLRSLALLLLSGGVMLFATPVGAAQSYLMTGKFARSNGVSIDIPLIGNNPGSLPNCGRSLGTATMGGKTMIPGMTPIYQGYRSMISMTMVPTPAITYTMFANRHGCVSVAGAIAATAAAAGAAFTLPSMAFSRPLPGMTVAVGLDTVANVPQIATSFRVTGPPMGVGTGTSMGTPTAPPAGTMNNGTNTAAFRFFHKSAWLSQTGRAGAKFTWCFGNPNCTMVSQAKGYPDPTVDPAHQLIVKYTPGANKFGGTMSHIITSGPNPSSLVASVGGVLQFLVLEGMGEQPTGRGYADYLTDAIMGGPAFAMFMVGPVYVPQLMGIEYLITTVNTMLPGTGTGVTATINKNFGFPLTTGTVLARNTGKDIQNNPVVRTLTGMGGDAVTGMGARNISLVAGSVNAIDSLAAEGPGLVQVFLPEPGAPAQLIAGVVVLLGIAVWRSR